MLLIPSAVAGALLITDITSGGRRLAVRAHDFGPAAERKRRAKIRNMLRRQLRAPDAHEDRDRFRWLRRTLACMLRRRGRR